MTAKKPPASQGGAEQRQGFAVEDGGLDEQRTHGGWGRTRRIKGAVMHPPPPALIRVAVVLCVMSWASASEFVRRKGSAAKKQILKPPT